MAVYFFDKEQRVSKILTDNNTLSSIQTQELSDDLLIDYLTVSMPNNENVTESEYMAVKSHEGNAQTFDMYRVTNVVTQNEITTFTGIQLAYYELAGYVVEDIRPTNQEVATVATQIVAGTEWRVGYVASSLKRVTTNFYYISAKEAFAKLQEAANCEVVFKVEISGTGVIDKWVEIYKQLGDKTLKRFNYGSNALTIEREIGKNDIYTALIGLGKGEEVGDGYGRKINFSDIEWKKSSGKPVDKPIGQKYIELPEATAQFGIKTKTGKKARIGIVDFGDVEDKNELIQATYDTLIDTARPKVQFKTTVLNIGATNIGDTVTIHRHDLDIHYMARVYKVVRDKLNDDLTQIELGDAISQSSTKRQSSTVKLVGKVKDELEQNINYVMQSADGKNALNYGNDEPTTMRTGDLWYRDHPSLAGQRQMLIYDGTAWVEQEYRADMLTGTFDANTLNVINIHMDSLVGNRSEFIQTYWNGINNNIKATSTEIIATDTASGQVARMTSSGEFISKAGGVDLSQAYLRNGRLYFRNTDGTATLNAGAHPIQGEGAQQGSVATARSTRLYIGRFSDYLDTNANAPVVPYISLQYAGALGDESRGYVKVHKFMSMSGKSIEDVQALSGYELSLRSTFGKLMLGVVEANKNYNTIEVGYANAKFNGNIEFAPGYEVKTTSDKRLKNIIGKTKTKGLEELRKLNVVDYTWKNGDFEEQIGLIAQDTPFLSTKTSDGNYALLGNKHTMLLTVAMQEMDKELNETKQELADLKALLKEKGVIE